MDLGPICHDLFKKSMNFIRRLNGEKIFLQTRVLKIGG